MNKYLDVSSGTHQPAVGERSEMTAEAGLPALKQEQLKLSWGLPDKDKDDYMKCENGRYQKII